MLSGTPAILTRVAAQVPAELVRVRSGPFALVEHVWHMADLEREFAERIRSTESGTRWSYCHDLGRTRVVVIENRAGRVLRDDRRSIFDDGEWRWIVERASGEFDHLIFAMHSVNCEMAATLVGLSFDRSAAWR